MSQPATGFSPKAAMYLAAICVVGSDGEFHEEELQRLRTLLQADEHAFLMAYQFYRDRPQEVCVKVVAAVLNDEQKRATLGILFDIAKADGDYGKLENEMIRKFAVAFELPISALNAKASTPEYNLALFD